MSYPHYTGDSESWGTGGRHCIRWNGPPPKVVCLCGSSRFGDAFARANLELTLAGAIVLSIGCVTSSDDEIGVDDATKARLDELHKRKIDLADEVFVLNVGGYVGASTASEIAYAENHYTPVRYLEVQLQ
jgi:hypothetical protein